LEGPNQLQDVVPGDIASTSLDLASKRPVARGRVGKLHLNFAQLMAMLAHTLTEDARCR